MKTYIEILIYICVTYDNDSSVNRSDLSLEQIKIEMQIIRNLKNNICQIDHSSSTVLLLGLGSPQRVRS